MKNLILSFFVVSIALFSCQQKKPANQFTITGAITGLEDSFIYMHYREANASHWDSAKVNNEQFTFNGKTSYPEMAALFLINKDTGRIVKFRVKIPFFLENAEIRVEGNIDSLEKTEFSGSKSQSDYVAYQASLAAIKAQRKLLFPKYKSAKKRKDSVELESIQSQYHELALQESAQTRKFIRSHPKSFVSLYELKNLVYKTQYVELHKLYSGLDTSLKNSTKGKALGKKLAVMKISAIGQPAPLFTMNDEEGVAVGLSDYKGRYVLVDFWASWCAPCQAENPNVAKMYHQYKDKGFDVLGVSLDKDSAKWVKAVQHDRLTWKQVSDLQGWKNKAARKYGVNAIPANYLVGPDGKIMARNLRGKALRNKLKALFD